MITHADIYHYKSIAEANIDFQQINVIVGPNGVGKSNIVDALYFVHDAIVEDLDTAITKRHGIESVRQWSRTRPYHVIIDLQFKNDNGHGSYRLSIASARGAFRVVDEFGEWTGRDPFSDPSTAKIAHSSFFRAPSGELNFTTAFDEYAKHLPPNMKVASQGDLFITSLAGPFTGFASLLFHHLVEEIKSFSSYSIYPNTLRQPQVVSREETLLQDGSNLATIIKKLNSGHKRNKDSLLDSLKVVLPITADIQVRSAGGYYVPVLRVREPGGDVHELNMSQVSDGTLRILGLLTAFYQPRVPGKIAVEEPEQMIHPGVLPVIADAANDYARGGTDLNRQLFITTHSPSFLDLFDPSSIVWATFTDGATRCGRITDRQVNLIKHQLFSPGEILVSEGFFG